MFAPEYYEYYGSAWQGGESGVLVRLTTLITCKRLTKSFPKQSLITLSPPPGWKPTVLLRAGSCPADDAIS